MTREAGSAEKKLLQKARDDALRAQRFGEQCMDHALTLPTPKGGGFSVH